MRLRVFLPNLERPDEATRFAWILFDGRREVLREGTTTVAEIPVAGEVEAVLPTSRVLFARLKLPRVNAATIRELLPYAVEDRLLADPSHIHAIAGRTGEKGETIVAVVDREWLRAMLEALASRGIRPSSAWPESALLAGGHADWNLVWGPARGMLVDDDGVATTCDAAPGGEAPFALKLALDEASARGERPSSVRVHTEASTALPDLARWAHESGVAFAPGTQWETLARGEPEDHAIDLLQGEFQPRRATRVRLPRAAIALAVLIAALQLGFVALDAWRLARERASLEARREAIFRDAFPEARAVVDPDLQMRRNLADLKRAHGIPTEDAFLGQLSRASREGGPARSIEYSDGKLVVKRAAGEVVGAAK